MKLKRYLKASAAIIGVALAHGAQADTIIDWSALPLGVGNNTVVQQTYGDNAAASSAGVTVNGFGTPNIGLTWQGVGGTWQYYIDSVWSAGQLDSSNVGDQHNIEFAPNNSTVSVVIKSLNFHPYYVSNERWTYNWTVLNGETVLDGGSVTFASDATKDHPAVIDVTGPPGATLTLRLMRVASTLGAGETEGSTQNIAVDDITFAQIPEMTVLAGPVVTSVVPSAGRTGVRPDIFYQATIANGDVGPVAGSIELRLDDTLLSNPTVMQANGVTTVEYQQEALLPAGSVHTFSLIFNDDATPSNRYTNLVNYTVANYVDKILPGPIVFEDFDTTAEGSLPPGWTAMSMADFSPLSDPDFHFQNLDSAAYTNWIAVDAFRFTGSFETYSHIYKGEAQPQGEADDYKRVLAVNPLNVVNGVFLPELTTGRLLFANSGYRVGVFGQIMYLFSPDFDLTGKSDVWVAFHSLWEQNQNSMASLEYSVDQGATWLPIIYMLEPADVLTNMDGTINGQNTFSMLYNDVPIIEGDEDGMGNYGAYIGVTESEWANLGPYISPRVQDNPTDSKRVECFRLPAADNQAHVRFRFAHVGIDAWYWGIDDFGLYSIANVPEITEVHRDGSNLIISWPGAANVKLQMTSSLVKPVMWEDVPGTTGASQATIPIVNGAMRYFALVRF